MSNKPLVQESEQRSFFVSDTGAMAKKPNDPQTSFPRQELALERLPDGIFDMRRPPTQAHLWGEIPPGPWVGIVGTRSPSPHGKRSAFLLARELAEAGVTIVSGGALGVDSAAHRGALAGGGRTLVVAPVWWNRSYPASNRSLFEAVLRHGGGYLCIAEESAQPFKWVFFRRNEALVALSNLVVLGECPMASGAKNAMLHARKLQRPRFVVPFPFNEERARGSHQEVVVGEAELLIDTSPILERLEQCGSFANPDWWQWRANKRAEESAAVERLASRRVGPAKGEATEAKAINPTGGRQKAVSGAASQKPQPRPSEGGAVLKVLCHGARTVEQICELSSLPAEVVQYQVLLLTLEGLVAEDSDGLLRYQLAGHE